MAESGICLYVSHHGSNEISVWRMSSETGELTPVQTVPTEVKVMPLAVSPDRRFLYAGLRKKPWTIASYAIDGQSGKLTHLTNTPAFESAVYLCTDQTGRYLITANNSTNYDKRTGIFSINAIGDRGCVQSPYEMFRTPVKLHCVRPDPTNRFLFGASCDGDMIVRYAFDAVTGIVNPDPLPPVMVLRRTGPRHIMFHPNNRFMYMIGEYSASIYAFRYDARNGSLSEIQIAEGTPPGFEPVARGDGGRLGISSSGADLHFTPDGRRLYTSARASSTIAAFRVDPVTGLLTCEGHFPMPKEPRGFNIDPTGRYLFAAGEISKNLVSFRIDSETGSLTRIREYAVGEGPNWLEFVTLP